ncbi:TBC1D13 [Symbiodinium natans]|uniref:TBC1D13 protein n=1 Tax=Symbiodinium natans TaxID=878477 RepID=A0A812KGR2_9DINO|nr:TBC1D13 [Symbiodinium natans]
MALAKGSGRHRRLAHAAITVAMGVTVLSRSCGPSSAFRFDLLGGVRPKHAETEAEVEAKRQEAEEKEREKQRQKEADEEAKQKQAEEEKERKRRRRELIEKEADAVKQARLVAHRPLNSFEERRVRRQVRSEFLGGGGLQVDDGHKDDWAQPLKPEIKAQLDDAVRFFAETMRVPAALIGSAALGMLFLPPTKFGWRKEDHPQPEVFDILYRAYVILTAATFCLELTTVLETSNAHVQLLELGRHGLALEPTAMDLIMANLEFEYLVCSLSFTGGVVCFMLATLCRVLAVFVGAHRSLASEPELCFVVATMMLSFLLWWLHLVNMRIMEFANFGAMIQRLLFFSFGCWGTKVHSKRVHP